MQCLSFYKDMFDKGEIHEQGEMECFPKRHYQKTKVFKREDGKTSKSKNLYVIICAALVFSLILSAAIFAGQIRANKTAKETSKVIETVKTDTLSGTAFETSIKELNQDMAKELTGLGEYLARLDKSVLENQTRLEEVNSTSAESSKEIYHTLESNLKEIENSFSNINNILKDSSTTLQENIKQYLSENNTVLNEHLTELQENMTSTQEQILLSQTTITEAVEDLKTVVKNKFDNTTVQIENTEKKSVQPD